MGSLLGLLLLAATPVRPFAEERLLLDRRLETLRRMLPDGAAPANDVTLLNDLARAAGVGFDIRARAPLEKGTAGDVPVDVVGSARFAEIDRFFRQVALSARLIDVESLALSAGPGDSVRLTALLHFPYRPARTPLPPPPEGLRTRLSEVTRPVADQFLRDQALALAKSDAVASLRRSRRNPRLFLSELAAVVRDRPVVLKEATLGDEFVVRGLTVGEGPMRALELRLERGFFRVAEILMARAGGCHRFEVRGRSPVVGIEAELPLPAVDDPFRQDDAPCIVDRDAGGVTVLRFAPVKPGARTRLPAPRGTLSLRLRDMDLTDVFFVLHLLTGQGFLVDEDVRGRVSIDVNQVALDDVLALLAKDGAAVSPPGPLRRVSRTAARAALPAATGEGTPITFALKRAAVADVLAVIGEADPTGPPPPRVAGGRLSLWASEARLADVRAAVLQIARPAGAASGDGDPPPLPPSTERRLLVRTDELSVSEFQLAGVASAGQGWTAFAYSPTGVLNAYRRGDRLAD
ncbi:MAG TPA: hypothetical protein VIK51_18500, partial [Vicinamibacteria bacterium]